MITPSWTTISPDQLDLRLVVSDMDGTLLTEGGDIPEAFWPLLDLMHSRGITFVPASGRQYATLANLFAHRDSGVSYIAENGNLIVHDGDPLVCAQLDQQTVQDVIATVRSAARTRDIGLVVCGLHSAYVERTDRPFLEEAEKYYAKLATTHDLAGVTDSVLKLAVFDFADAQEALSTAFTTVTASQQVVVSGKNWLDIMRPDIDKGRAVRSLQRVLGITPEQTAVFGDYLNDLQMLDTAEWSFAMQNAHPDIRSRANYLAPTNREHGVITVLSHLLSAHTEVPHSRVARESKV